MTSALDRADVIVFGNSPEKNKEEPRMELKATLKEYTALEFEALVEKIWAVDLLKREHDDLINYFDRIVGHPQGADLLFYPDERFGSNSAVWVVYTVSDWYQKQGMAAFKGVSSSVSPPPLAMSPIARAFAEVQKIASDLALLDQAVKQAFEKFEQAVLYFRGLQGTQLEVSVQEANIRNLERAQRETRSAARKFEFREAWIESAKSRAQYDLTYARSEHAQWQNIAQQINTTHIQYLARLADITQRHPVVHVEAEAMLNTAQQHLIRSRSLAKLGPAHAACVINGSLNFIDKRPALLLQGQSSALELSQQVDLQKSIRSAVAEFSWQNTTGAPLATQCAPVLHFGFSSRADAQIYGLSTPLSELVPIEGMDWQALARSRAEIEIPFRMSSAVITATPGTSLLGMQGVSSMSQVFVTASLSGHSTPKVRVRPAYPGQGVSAYSFTADGAAPVTISWAGEISLENNKPGNWQQSRSLLFVESPPVPVLTPLGNNEGVHFDDYIVVFPTASELDPLYVMFRNRHEYPV